MSKPTFDSLTPEQVNTLIAEKVMGWHREFFRYGEEPEHVSPYESWVDSSGAEQQHVKMTIYADCQSQVFSPYHSLDDCWKAEEKIPEWDYETSWTETLNIKSYCFHLGSMIGGSTEDGYDGAMSLIHATAKEKCEAMLRAIGDVE